MADPQHLMHVTGADNVCFTALGKSSKWYSTLKLAHEHASQAFSIAHCTDLDDLPCSPLWLDTKPIIKQPSGKQDEGSAKTSVRYA